MEETVEERKHSRLEWFFYIILLPFLFTIALTGLLLTLLGYDVTNQVLIWGNKVPYVEKVLPEPRIPDEMIVEQPEYEKQVAELNQQLSGLNEEIQQKQFELESIQKEKETAEQSIQKLKDQMIELQKQMEDDRLNDEQRKQKINELAKLYADMSASKAAPILSNLSMEEGVLVLEAMKPDERAAIVSKLDPKKAADLTILLKDTQLSENDEIAALQQRVQALTKALAEIEKTKRDVEEMAASLSIMKPEASADIIIKMLESPTEPSEKEKALNILGKMSNQQRGIILENISKKGKTDLSATIINHLTEE